MSMFEHAYETTLWADAKSVPAVRAIVARMGSAIKVIGVGGPRQPAVSDLAKVLDADYDDDLRRLIIDKPATYILLATMNQVDPAIITSALKQGCTVLALEPIAADFRQLESFTLFARQPEDRDRSSTALPGHFIHCPAFTQSPGWLRAADPQLVLGPIQSTAVLSASRQGEGSLFARLHEAWRMALDLTQMPQSIECSILQPSRVIDASLRDLTGHLSMHARMPDESSIQFQLHEISAATTPAPCDRMIHLIGELGRLRVTDCAYELFDHQGSLLDEAVHQPTDKAQDSPFTFAAAVAHHWRQLIDRPALANPQMRDRAKHEAMALACCLTCLLSARTGTAESPAKLLTVNGWR